MIPAKRSKKSPVNDNGGVAMITRVIVFVGLLLLVGSTIVARAFGDVEPGDVITKANAEKVKDLTSPGLYWCVQHGLPMRIVAPRKLAWPPAYREATEKYSAQVKLSEDGLTLEGYVAGAPFPAHRSERPAGRDSSWCGTTTTSRSTTTTSTSATSTPTPAPSTTTRAMTIERHFLIDHFRRLWYVNRLYVDPKPTGPEPGRRRVQGDAAPASSSPST